MSQRLAGESACPTLHIPGVLRAALHWNLRGSARTKAVKIPIFVGVAVAVMFVILTLFAVRPRKGQHRMVYHLEGKRGAETAAAVLTRDGTDHETVHLPLTLGFWAPPGTRISLSAQFQDDSTKGSLEAKLYADGQLLQSVQSSDSESATISCTVP